MVERDTEAREPAVCIECNRAAFVGRIPSRRKALPDGCAHSAPSDGTRRKPEAQIMRIVVDLQGAQNESRFRGIGRYSLSLARAMAKRAANHEIRIVLNARFPDSLADILNAFDGLVPPEHISVFEIPAPLKHLNPDYRWRVRAAELAREQFLARLQPDIVHVSSWFDSPFDDTVASLDTMGLDIPQAATLYDLIPLLRPDTYLQNAQLRDWYLRRADALRGAGRLLAISESSADEVRQLLQIPEEKIAVIGAGIDEIFRPPAPDPDRDQTLRNRYGLKKPFLLYAGASDPRKNLSGLLRAIVLLPPELRKTRVLACVGKMHSSQQEELIRLVDSLGLKNSVVFLGYVPDAELVRLYAMCELFVLPSLHEGFGLPAAEAMACGAPVIGSNTTSVPAVIGRADALFDPSSPSDIAQCMERVLSSTAFQAELRAHGIQRSAMFNWNDVARRTIETFEALHGHRGNHTPAAGSPAGKRRVAVVANLDQPPYPLTDFLGVLSDLAKSFEVTCICDVNAAYQVIRRARIPFCSPSWFRENGECFDTVLYVLSGKTADAYALPLLETWPGIVLLADTSCADLIAAPSKCVTVRAETAVYDSNGLSGLLAVHRNIPGEKQELFCSEALHRLSDGVLTHDADQIDHVRLQFGAAAASRMRVVPAPAANALSAEVAARWIDAITDLLNPQILREKKFLDAISTIDLPPQQGDVTRLAAALAANMAPFGLPQILVDVSTIAETDARTGVQRVVRSILSELLSLAPAGWRIEPVRVEGESYVYARDFAARMFNLHPRALPPDGPVETQRGDLFLGLDLTAHLVVQRRRWFEMQQLRGVSIVFVIYDLLPLFRPDLFLSGMFPVFSDWATILAQMADGVVCISRSVAEAFSVWTMAQAFPRRKPLRIGWFHLGADLEASLPTAGLPPDSQAILRSLKEQPFFLSVGTLEPRKRYSQTLDAFEQLWAEGTGAGLVIVGKPGWMTDELAARIENHPELGSRLLWLKGVSDEMLTEVYISSTALLAASEGEGFGLPLIEAARHHLPILARDLPVFHEIAGEHAAYFSGDDSESLASALRNWLRLRMEQRHPQSDGITYLTWRESALQLLDVVLRHSRRVSQTADGQCQQAHSGNSAASSSTYHDVGPRRI